MTGSWARLRPRPIIGRSPTGGDELTQGLQVTRPKPFLPARRPRCGCRRYVVRDDLQPCAIVGPRQGIVGLGQEVVLSIRDAAPPIAAF